jgi:serine/threonine-protein kinase RsbW
MTVSQVLDESWSAVAGNVPIARHTVLAHLVETETADPPLNDIGLAVCEAVTNVVNHAYLHTDPGAMRVRVAVGSDDIEVMVEDDGSGMAPRPDSPGLGLGLGLMAALTDRFDVSSPSGGGTRLCLRFDAHPGTHTLPA